MRIVTVVGARPQFIKAAAVSRAIADSNKPGQSGDIMEEVIVHTGQHFDRNMSDVFFEQLGIPVPRFNLGVAGLGHGAMTGRMLESIEGVLADQSPDWVLVYGDTNSTLAGALAAVKLGIPVAHVEAGLRSGNPNMPEEINRVLTDRISTALFCPTRLAIQNLHREGFPFPMPGQRTQAISNVGDVMLDVVRHSGPIAERTIGLDRWGVQHKGYALCTIHRQENTESPARFRNIVAALRETARHLPVILPLHPRTRDRLGQWGGGELQGVTVIDPLPYLEMQRLLMSARLVLTDSGGLQKEAFFHAVPCVTLRDETEWVETVDAGWNVLTGADPSRIAAAVAGVSSDLGSPPQVFGDGNAAAAVVRGLQALGRVAAVC